jgi:thermitase
MGLTDDLIVAAALDRVRRTAESRGERLDIVVLTAGCHTPDNRCPPVLRRALDRLGDTIVVASAGNDGTDRPF